MSLSDAQVFGAAVLCLLWGIALIQAGGVRPRTATNGELGRLVEVLGVLMCATGSIFAVVWAWRLVS